MVESLKSSEVNAARLVEKVKAGYKKVDDEMKKWKENGGVLSHFICGWIWRTVIETPRKAREV